MNSFSTSDDTRTHLSKKHRKLVEEADSELVQNKSPKIDARTLAPASYPEHPEMEWCGARHRSALLPSRLSRHTTDARLTLVQGGGCPEACPKQARQVTACLQTVLRPGGR